MSRNFWDIAINIIGGIAAAGIYEAITRRLLPYLDKRKFKCVFGEDVFNDSGFHLVYALLKPALLVKEDDLRQATGSFLKKVRAKVSPGLAKIRNGKPRALHTRNPVSIGGVRAIKHVSSAVEAKSGRVTISSDSELEGEPNISFVSFGGEAGNDKTGEVFRDGGNDLVVLDQPGEKGKSPSFVSKTSGRTLLTPVKDYDYGLILKIRPSQYPKRVWFVCAGFAESGTSGAAWYLASKWKDIYNYAKDGPFAYIVQVDHSQDKIAKWVIRGKTCKDIEFFADQWERQHKKEDAPKGVTRE